MHANYNPEQSSTTKLDRHIVWGYLIFTQIAFGDKKVNLIATDMNEDCMKKFCKTLGEYTVKMINYGEKINDRGDRKKHKSYVTHTNCYICKEKFEHMDDKESVVELEIIVITQANIVVMHTVNKKWIKKKHYNLIAQTLNFIKKSLRKIC